MEFNNPLASGIYLVREALRSPNYDPGVDGWTINQDGTAEFNDATFRGDLQSSNYVPGVSGWHLDEAGMAEFYNIIARGLLATGAAPDAYASLFDTGSGYAQLVLSTDDPAQTAPGYVFAASLLGAGNALYLYSPEMGYGRVTQKFLGSQDGIGRPQIEFARAGTALELLVKIYGELEAQGLAYFGTGVVTGNTGAANTVLNGNQLYARNATANNGNLYLNHASSGNLYLGQSGNLLVSPGNNFQSASGYMLINWSNGLPVAIGNSSSSVGRLGGSAGWLCDYTLNVNGELRNAGYPIGGSANVNLQPSGLFQRISSSRRYKKDIEELTVDSSKILELVPRRYKFKHRFDIIDDELTELDRDEAPWETGFIAEEADEIGLTEWVEYREEDGAPESFHYTNFVAAHQLVLREQAKRIAELEARIVRLEGLLQ